MHPALADRSLRKGVGSIPKPGEDSDATIECEGNIFRVHKSIICPQSDYFARAFASKTGFKEAHSNTIVLQEIDPTTVRAIVQYLYHAKYDNPESRDDSLTLNVDVYTAAEMYQLPGLKQYALEKFKEGASDMFTLDTFPDAVRTIFESTVEEDRGMRDSLINVAISMIGDISTNVDSKFNYALSEVASFGGEMVLALVKHRQEGSGNWMLRCPSKQCSEPNNMGRCFEPRSFYRCRWCFHKFLGEHWMGICRCFSIIPRAVDCHDYN